MVDRGQHDKADKSDRSHRHDNFLNRLPFGKRASAHPPRQKRGILLHQIERDRNRCGEIDRQERPALPVVKGARRDEQQRSHHEKKDREPAECPSMQVVHPAMLTYPHRRSHALRYCCFSQNDSRPCDAEPPMTQGMPTATCPSAAAETQPRATAPTPTCPQKSRLRRESDPLVLSSSTAASASLRTAASCTVSAASITSVSGALIAAGWPGSSARRNSRSSASRTA